MADLRELIPELQPYALYLTALITKYDPGARVTSVYRSYTDQLDLWNNRARNPYPVARPGTSYHQYRRAFDVSARPEVLAWAGEVWRSWGGTVPMNDPIHFQA